MAHETLLKILTQLLTASRGCCSRTTSSCRDLHLLRICPLHKLVPSKTRNSNSMNSIPSSLLSHHSQYRRQLQHRHHHFQTPPLNPSPQQRLKLILHRLSNQFHPRISRLRPANRHNLFLLHLQLRAQPRTRASSSLPLPLSPPLSPLLKPPVCGR